MPAAFQLYRKSQTFFGDDGQEIPGGYLSFFGAGTSSPKHVYSNKSLGDGTDNGVTVALDASSRPSVAIWGSGAYDVKIYDADDVQVGEDLQIEIPGGEATALPALDPDKFLTNDGAVMSWADILQVPDPTGHSDQVLSSDGSTLTWIDKPADGAAGTSDIDSTTTGIININSGKWVQMVGSGTVSGGGGRSCTATVTFPGTFASAPKVFVQAKGSNASNAGNVEVKSRVSSVSTTGCTIVFSTTTGGTSADSSNSNSALTGTVSYDYTAILST